MSLLQPLLPDGIYAAEMSGDTAAPRLSAQERRLLGRVTPRRAREFAAGRRCARRASAPFGGAGALLGIAGDRRPQWPGHLTGSITHTERFCAAAVGERRIFCGIGIDAEKIGGVSHDLWRHLFVPGEIEWLETLPAGAQPGAATLMFSAKEAFYKCQFAVTGQWLEFRDVAVDAFRVYQARGEVTLRAVNRVEWFRRDQRPAIVRYAMANDLVLSAMAVAHK